MTRRLGAVVGTAALLVLCLTGSALADRVAILDSAREALGARIHILEGAEETLDILYFAIHDDEVTRFALGLLREKALDGVRVRMVTNPRGFKVDSGLLHYLQSLDTFEIRVFDNPTMGRFKSLRQLHDKLMLADGDHYITGGRNLGAAYFDLSKKYNKKDRDIYVIGASTKAAGDYFEDLWSSSEVSLPTYKPYPKKREGQLAEDITEMETLVAEARASENYELAKEFPIELREVEDKYVQFVHDEVEDAKVQTTEVLVRLTLDADESVLVQTPYVVPSKGLFHLMEVKEQQGVPVTYVTNSVKSTVNVIATAATERYKKRMLDYEPVVYLESTGTEMLHAKSMVYRAKEPEDGGPPCWGSIGSYNIDPRSARLNTETFVLVRDCGFADELEEIINSYTEGSVRLESRDDLASSKALKKEIPFSKRFQLALLKFLTPLYRSQI